VHPDAHLATYAGLMQADAYAGFNRLYEAGRKPGPIIGAMCWAHARRKFFDLARLNKAPMAIEAVERIDALSAIERDINGKPPPERRRIRNEHSRPLVTELEKWLRQQRTKLSAGNQVAKPARLVLVDRAEPLLEERPVDRPRQLHQRVVHGDDRIEPRAQQIALSGVASFLWSHTFLRRENGITTRDSWESRKRNLHAFGPPSPESLQSRSPSRPENRLSLNRLVDSFTEN
jgi:Transposase IS66 family